MLNLAHRHVPACGIRYQLCRNGWAGQHGGGSDVSAPMQLGFEKSPSFKRKERRRMQQKHR